MACIDDAIKGWYQFGIVSLWAYRHFAHEMLKCKDNHCIFSILDSNATEVCFCGSYSHHAYNAWLRQWLGTKEVASQYQMNSSLIDISTQQCKTAVSTLLMYWRYWRLALNHRYIRLKCHDDVIKWKYFPRYWPFVWGIHRWPVNSPHKGQWRGALMFSLICAWINDWVNNRKAGDLRCHRAHYDVIVKIMQVETTPPRPPPHVLRYKPNSSERAVPERYSDVTWH